MKNIFSGSDGIRTIIFPVMVKSVRQRSFYEVKPLRAAIRTKAEDARAHSLLGAGVKCGILRRAAKTGKVAVHAESDRKGSVR